jgi:hypothetical protein
MCKIHRIFFCEEISQGLFGRFNLVNYIPSNLIILEQTPYTLKTTLVIEGEASQELYSSNVSISLEFKNLQGKSIIETTSGNLKLAKGSSHDFETFILPIPFIFEFPEYGTLQIIVFIENNPIFQSIFRIDAGQSPTFHLTELPNFSGILSKKKSTFSLEPILGMASQELILIDQYLTPDFLLQLMPFFPPNIQVKVLTGYGYKDKNKKDYAQNFFQIKAVPNSLEIKFGRIFHDRFIIVNWTECFHFGHSLKDLLSGRISKYSKIADQQDIDDLKKYFNSEWSEAKAL